MRMVRLFLSSSRSQIFHKLQPIKKRLRHRCFPVNFAKFLRISSLQSTSRWLLSVIKTCTMKYCWYQQIYFHSNFTRCSYTSPSCYKCTRGFYHERAAPAPSGGVFRIFKTSEMKNFANNRYLFSQKNSIQDINSWRHTFTTIGFDKFVIYWNILRKFLRVTSVKLNGSL